MIDLRVSNEKLFWRATDLVSRLTGVETPAAVAALISAIQGATVDDSVCLEPDANTVKSYVALAAPQAGVVPLAIAIAAVTAFADSAKLPTPAELRAVLAAEPVLRRAIDAAISH
eukprot:gnl/Ergobibamus_cyprinoides/1969.p1 GENE.gnl/Ergobibamus_cyprinoides/1969~~gnl/Ergobibamus_cyprinoides/1969.p1  ORF type:complete len:123 (-),score=25.86 gnl/Ergobibamus_cyprinoides/1969:679-1023(-)